MRTYKGLFLFALYDMDKTGIFIFLLMPLSLGIAAIVTMYEMIWTLFYLMSVAFIALRQAAVLEREHWLRYQLAMPITRKQMITSFFQYTLFLPFLGLLVVAFIWGIGFIFQDGMREIVFPMGLGWILFGFMFVLIVTGMNVMLNATPLRKRLGPLYPIICIVPSAVVGIATGLFGRTIFDENIRYWPLLVGVVIFVVSCMASRRLYGKIDF